MTKETTIALACSGLLAPAVALAQAPAPIPPGRLLASNCFQCHGTDGRGGFEEIAGKSAEGLFSELKEMQRKTPGNDLMVPHAKGYSDEQLRAIAAYLSTIR